MSKRWGWREASDRLDSVPMADLVAAFFTREVCQGRGGAAWRPWGDSGHTGSPSFLRLLKVFLFVKVAH